MPYERGNKNSVGSDNRENKGWVQESQLEFLMSAICKLGAIILSCWTSCLMAVAVPTSEGDCKNWMGWWISGKALGIAWKRHRGSRGPGPSQTFCSQIQSNFAPSHKGHYVSVTLQALKSPVSVVNVCGTPEERKG